MDTYSTIARIASTAAFQERIYACAAQQGEADPTGWAWQHRYSIASSPTWGAKVDSWLAANPDGDPDGWAIDPSVIADLDILATVQAMLG
jgi:hypothetical protein